MRGGIPRFVRDDAYAESFGSQWHRFRRTQFDSNTGIPLSYERLRRIFGENLFATLKGRQILEAGCGAGRFTEVLLKFGACVTSIDLSVAVDVNAANFPQDTQHRVAQADILDLPLRPEGFDFVMCLGVLQHTPSPELAIQKLYDQVRRGGWLIIDHYAKGIGRATSLKPLYRWWLKRQPDLVRWKTVERLARMFLPLHKRFRDTYPLWFVLSRISPLSTYYRVLPHLPESLQREFAILDTHDALTDWYKHVRTSEEIERILRHVGADCIQCWSGGNGIEARCRKPD